MAAPSLSALNFAQTTVGWTSGVNVARDENPLVRSIRKG